MVRLQAELQLLQSQNVPVRFVTMSPSFGNWQKSYDVGVYPLVMSKYGVLPNEDELTIIRDRIMNDNVQFIAYEEGMPQDWIDLFNRIRLELDLTRIDLNNGFTLSANDLESNNDYITKMYQNLETLEAAAQ